MSALLIISAVCLSGSAVREGLDKAAKEQEKTCEAVEALRSEEEGE